MPPVRSDKKARGRGFFCRSPMPTDYFSFVSLYSTCFRGTGSNFLISILSCMVFLFLSVSFLERSDRDEITVSDRANVVGM
jgi:hypothetical protein